MLTFYYYSVKQYNVLELLEKQNQEELYFSSLRSQKLYFTYHLIVNVNAHDVNVHIKKLITPAGTHHLKC